MTNSKPIREHHVRALPPGRAVAGQALPLVLVFLLVLCIGLLMMFNTGQLVSKKVELTNAADAAAYSVAIEQARARNLAAYLNRGRVANEVAIAQMVSLNSFLTMVHSTANHAERVMDVLAILTSWIPGVDAIVAAIDRALAIIDNALKAFRKGFIPFTQGEIGFLDQVLDNPYALAAQAVLGRFGAYADVLSMTNKVVQANAPGASVTGLGQVILAKNVNSAANQLELYRTGTANGLTRTSPGAERYRNVVMASRDKFTRTRSGSGLIFFSNQGGTDLVEYNRWSGVDAFQFKLVFLFFSKKVPIGWGGAQALPNGKGQPRFFAGMNNGRGWKSPYDNKRYKAYDGATRSSIAGKLIEGDPAGSEMGFNRSQAYFKQYRYGLTPSYHDVKKGYSETPEGDRAGPIYTVEVGSDQSKLVTSKALGIGRERMQLDEQTKGNQMRAMSSAQVYFNRPNGLSAFTRSVWGKKDGKFEQGSMFSPYWQVRLVQTPRDDRTYLWAGK